jgi:glycosyltransferase involved in cell wall biosynthesis
MMHLCEGLTQLGSDVELICLRIRTLSSEPTNARSIWDVYGIDSPFRVTMVPTLLRQEAMGSRTARVGILGYRLLVYPLYAFVAYLRGGHGRRGRTVFYSRNYGCAAGVLLLRSLLGDRARIVLEVHVPPSSRVQTTVLRLVDGVACQSVALQRALVELGLIDPRRSIGRHGGCSPGLMERVGTTRAQARDALGWSRTDRIACYTGKVAWGMREIELFVQTAEQLRDDRIRLVVVGGRADHVDHWRDELARRGVSNVEFAGFVSPADALIYQMGADVLLLYYPSGNALNDYRSPGKLFEYMASGTPAVVSNYLSIREVVTDGLNGLLVDPDRPDLLSAAVRRVLDEPGLSARLSERAKSDVESFTWMATADATLSLFDCLWDEPCSP